MASRRVFAGTVADYRWPTMFDAFVRSRGNVEVGLVVDRVWKGAVPAPSSPGEQDNIDAAMQRVRTDLLLVHDGELGLCPGMNNLVRGPDGVRFGSKGS